MTKPEPRSTARTLFGSAILVALLSLTAGCNGPSAANITLRKQNQELQEKLDVASRTHAADAASLTAEQSSHGGLQTLPPARLDQLFTAHGLTLGRLCGGTKTSDDKSADDALKIYATPIDETGDTLKASGAFEIQAYDLDQPKAPLVGEWKFDSATAKKSWLGNALMYSYVLLCPFSQMPVHEHLTVHVKFIDDLTGRSFESQKVVRVTLASPGEKNADEKNQ